MLIVSIVILIALIFLIFSFSGILPLRTKSPGVDISVELRDLLLSRAEGAISQEQFERAQAALHASLLNAVRISAPSRSHHLRWAVPVFFLVLAGTLYLFPSKSKPPENTATSFTSSRIIVPQLPSNALSQPPSMPQASTAPAGMGQSNSGGDLNTAVKRLEMKMLKTPNNGDGWLLLARTYAELRQHKEAANAYSKAAALLPPDATLLADWVDARVVTNERKWDAESRGILKRALAVGPKHIKVLALAGSEAFDRTDYKQAIDFWKKIIEASPGDSMDVKLAEKNIQEANAMLATKKGN